jgi:mRNA interferase HicA
MNGAEFIRRLRAYAKANGLAFKEDPSRGKGDHRMVCIGNRCAPVGDLRKELKTGTVHGLCKQLGVDRNAL